MKHYKTIEKLKGLFPSVIGLETAILYGSFARKDATPNSDIDIQILISDEYDPGKFKVQLTDLFADYIVDYMEVELRNKVVVYFKSSPKLEFSLCRNISNIDAHFLGSEIQYINNSILYINPACNIDISNYLNQINSKAAHFKSEEMKFKQINNLIDKFIYEFESCSAKHRRSDGYQFYYFYNIALHAAIQLNCLAKGNNRFTFLPKYFISDILNKEEQQPFYSVKGTLFLPEANQQKRNLLDFFFRSIGNLVSQEKLNKLITFCEWVYDRDFFWNFRDLNDNNPKIKRGVIYRTATMSPFQDDTRFDKLLETSKITTVIDLRAEREVDELPYKQQTLAKFRYIHTPWDPWNQPQWFKASYNFGSDDEIAYRYFVLGCKEKIKQAMEAIIEERTGSVAIHCFAGKDRTGIFMSLLHMISEVPDEIIFEDYLASEVDMKVERLKLVMEIINGQGGILPYLLSCGLDETQLEKLKNRLLYGN